MRHAQACAILEPDKKWSNMTRFKTRPFRHQQEVFEVSHQKRRYALFWEMGCGKTKTTIDTFSYQFLSGGIDAVVIIAPNGVERNWVSDELPAHLWDEVAGKTRCYIYESRKAGNKSHRYEVQALLEHKGLSILAISYSAAVTKAGHAYLWKFLEKRRVFYILDEATHIKNPNAKRTKTILASSSYADYRRVLTGTPIANGPFDAYAIMKFLDKGFWREFKLDSFTMFKQYFGIFQRKTFGEQTVDLCVGYRNLDELNRILAERSSRVTKDEVLDLPPKLYVRRYFEITPEQWKIYNDLKEEFMAWIGSEELITAPLAITRLIRFQQVVCGYVPSDGGDPVHDIGDKNPRLELLAELAEEIPHQAIIWAKYTRDIDKIVALLGSDAVRYDGTVGVDDRERAKNAFQAGRKKWFVANPAAAGEGLTLHAAKTVVYYNNTFKLTERLQSEDRAHRIGQDRPVNYVDIVASGTVDEKIVDALLKKRDIASVILGDEIKGWI